MDCCTTTIAIPCKYGVEKLNEADKTRNSSDPAQKDDVCAGPRANDVAPDDPNHSISGVNMQSMCREVFN